MEETNKKEPNYLLAIFIIAQLLFFVIIGILIVNAINQNNKINSYYDQPKVIIEGLSSNDLTLRDDIIDDISLSLASAIEQNTTDLDLRGSKAIVREDSISQVEFAQKGFVALNFIVDIPSLEQSYQVYYKYPVNAANDQTTENPSAILCLEDEAQIIYPDFKCRSPYSEDIRPKIATEYTRFMEFDDFTITLDEDDPTQININPSTKITDGTNESYISQVKAFIQDLGVSPDLFKYYVVKETDLNYLNPY